MELDGPDDVSCATAVNEDLAKKVYLYLIINKIIFNYKSNNYYYYIIIIIIFQVKLHLEFELDAAADAQAQ